MTHDDVTDTPDGRKFTAAGFKYLPAGGGNYSWQKRQGEITLHPNIGGALEKYIGVKALKPFINSNLVLEKMVPFRLLEVEGLEKAVKGLPADLMIEICQGFVAALQASFDPQSQHPKMTDRQRQMALQASFKLRHYPAVSLGLAT